jgi:small nuclear ribonucleoprotein (snRNP)-like protein
MATTSTAARPLVAAVTLAALALAAHGEEPAGGVLELPGGRSLAGRLVPFEADGTPLGTLRWQAPLFTAPLEFHVDEITAVRFPAAKVAGARPGVVVHLRGGDAIEGELESLDADAVEVRPPAGWSPAVLRIDRAAVEGLTRTGADAAGGFVGPASLDAWQVTPEGAWRVERGCLRATRPSTATRVVSAASRAWYEFDLSWRVRPELRIAVAAAADPDADGFVVEMLTLGDGTTAAALIRRGDDRAVVEPLECPPPAARGLRLVVFVDQEAGRLAAFTEADGVAGPVAEATLPGGNASGRVRISLASGDVCLEGLRVGAWTAAEPLVDDRDTMRVVTRDGRVVEASSIGFDKAGDTLVVDGTGGQVRLPLADIAAATLPTAAAPAPPATLRATLASGATLAGDPVAVSDDAITLRVPGIAEPVRLPVAEIAALTAVGGRPEPRPLPGRVGTLVSGSTALVGCVVDGGAWSAGIAFQPQGAVAAVPFAGGAEIDATIEYVARAARDGGGVEVGGIGGMVNQNGDGAYVVTMLSEDGAAATDGRLQPGDRLLAIRPRPEGGFVVTKGLEVTTVMNLLRGRVGTPVVLRVATEGQPPRDIDLIRGPIHVAGPEILQQALDTHVRLAAAPADAAAGGHPSRAILATGDVVPCDIVAIDDAGVRLRTPVADGGPDTIVVRGDLLQAIELDPAVPPRDLPRSLVDRLLTLPRSQRTSPPTHLVRLRDGDYLRGRLVSLDADTLAIDVRGELKKLPRLSVARIIWLRPDPEALAGGADAPAAGPPAGLLVQGVSDRGRMTLVADAVADGEIRGTSPALGPGRIAIADVDRLLVGRGVASEAADLPYGQWRLTPAAEPRALREGGDASGPDRPGRRAGAR